ncbi:unnamed protein product [Moneuplotes crassus]|uniref:Uncharacterized protein n=1 Tax=Euplotes crassus TaxID=5936 RepID=A0AAD1XRC8_EUPCR|nr:unnamed protein product [Moneuplotes crassus]
MINFGNNRFLISDGGGGFHKVLDISDFRKDLLDRDYVQINIINQADCLSTKSERIDWLIYSIFPPTYPADLSLSSLAAFLL